MHNEMKGKLQSHEISSTSIQYTSTDCQEREIVLNPVFFLSAVATLISWSQCNEE
jgi:hypothetical protein